MGKKRERTGSKPTRYFDYSLLFIIIFLFCFGLVMLYSTSSSDGQLKYDDSSYDVKKQLFATSLGFMSMYLISRSDYHVSMRFS